MLIIYRNITVTAHNHNSSTNYCDDLFAAAMNFINQFEFRDALAIVHIEHFEDKSYAMVGLTFKKHMSKCVYSIDALPSCQGEGYIDIEFFDDIDELER